MNRHDWVVARQSRILVVDDEANNRALLDVLLTSEGHLVDAAASGEEALATVARQPPHLILLDIMMPGRDGYSVAATLKANPATSQIPIILVTALDDRVARMKGLTAGADDFLSKPIDRAELTVRVNNLLRLKAYRDHYDKYIGVLEGEVGSRTADLIESERLYRDTFDEAPVGIIQVGLDGQWLRFNQRLCELVGYTREELQTPEIQARIQVDTDEEEFNPFKELAEGAADHHVVGEREYRRRDGRNGWSRVSMSVHRSAQGIPLYFIVAIEEITEKKLLEAQVLHANRMDAIGGLASGVAHDFNNLLSVILSYTSLLLAEHPEAGTTRDDLLTIQGAGDRAAALTRQLLAFSRKQLLKPEVLGLNEATESVERILRRLIGENIELSVVMAPDLDRVLVDRAQFEQVLMNLAVNSRDAMPNGGKLSIQAANVALDAAYVTDHVGLKVGAYVKIVVSDTGCGMDAATQARVFEPFFTTKDIGKGTGLGLAMVYGIIRQSGGDISVRSKPGSGTAFTIHLPSTHRAPSIASTSADFMPTGGGETILLVEDDAQVRAVARDVLRRSGYEVIDAASGDEALRASDGHLAHIDLLLTDVVMPRMSGRQLADRLQMIRPTTKILFMSGYTDHSAVNNGVLNEGTSFLAKPFTSQTLKQGVRDALKHSPPSEEAHV